MQGFGSNGAEDMPLTVDRTALAAEADVVGQLVDVVGPAREEARQRRADFGNGADDGGAEGARTQPLDHPVAHTVPVVITDTGVNAVVTDDRQLAIFDGEVDQDSRPMRRPVHPEPGKDVARALHRLRRPPAKHMREPALDVDTDFRRSTSLGLAHGRGDRVEVGLADHAACPSRVPSKHHQSPLAPPPPELPPPPPEKSPPPPPPPQEPPPPHPPPPPQMIGGCELHPPRSAVTARRLEARMALTNATPNTPKISASSSTVAGSVVRRLAGVPRAVPGVPPPMRE